VSGILILGIWFVRPKQSREFSRDCGIQGVLWWVPTTENAWDSGRKSDHYGGSQWSWGPKV